SSPERLPDDQGQSDDQGASLVFPRRSSAIPREKPARLHFVAGRTRWRGSFALRLTRSTIARSLRADADRDWMKPAPVTRHATLAVRTKVTRLVVQRVVPRLTKK